MNVFVTKVCFRTGLVLDMVRWRGSVEQAERVQEARLTKLGYATVRGKHGGVEFHSRDGHTAVLIVQM